MGDWEDEGEAYTPPPVEIQIFLANTYTHLSSSPKSPFTPFYTPLTIKSL